MCFYCVVCDAQGHPSHVLHTLCERSIDTSDRIASPHKPKVRRLPHRHRQPPLPHELRPVQRASPSRHPAARHMKRLISRLRHCWPYGMYESMYQVSAENCATTQSSERICTLITKVETSVPKSVAK